MSEETTLTIAFSTLPERVRSVAYPQRKEDRQVMAVVQNVTEASYVIEEPRVMLVEMKSLGVAKSRNAALHWAKGKYLHFADDDIKIEEEGIAEAIEYLESHPECAIILAQAKDESGQLRKRYANKVTPLRLTNSARAATYEMIVRVAAIKEAKVSFDERFGAGAEYYLGDEYIFIADAIRAGLKGVHLPVVIAIHPKESSGSRWGSESDLKVRSEVFTRVFGWQAAIYRAAFLIKTENDFPGIKKAFKFIFNR